MGFLSDLFYLAAGIAVGCQESAKELPTQIMANHTMKSEYKQMCSALGARNAMGVNGHIPQSDFFNEKANTHKQALIEARKQWASCGGTLGGGIPGLDEIPEEYFSNPFGGGQ